jgi:N6-adenosine-specific RNA methylase IME4
VTYATIIADPPWRFGDALPGRSRGAAKNYKTMSVDEIKRYLETVSIDIAPDARLFLWRVASMQREALDVLDAWGFTLKTEIVWCKTRNGKWHFGMGRTVRGAHEVSLIAVRGNPPVLSHSVRSTFTGEVRAHSQKPEEFYGIVEALSPGPYLELFARQRRCGWASIGDELPPDPLTSQTDGA